MKTTLDCLPCLVRQSLDATRMIHDNPDAQERMMRDLLVRIGGMDYRMPFPALVQRIQRRLREFTGGTDPYRAAKEESNRIALGLLPWLREEIAAASDPLELAVRFAIAGNVIDLGAASRVTGEDVRREVCRALDEPFAGDISRFRALLGGARRILYLADNAGEIVFDRLLVEQIGPARITLAVRGGPVINDATFADAQAAGLDRIVEVIGNGSDAPGTILEDCDEEFRRRFHGCDLLLSKGQGNYESLLSTDRPVVFLFKVKCDVIAERVGHPVGTQVMTFSPAAGGRTGGGE